MLMSVATFMILRVPMESAIEQSRVQAVADTAAIAAEDSLRGLSTGIPCEVADVVAKANRAKIASCHILENSVYLSVRSLALGASIVAKAAAAPSGTY